MTYNLYNLVEMIAKLFKDLYEFLYKFLTAYVPGLNVPVYAIFGVLTIGAMVVILIVKFLT